MGWRTHFEIYQAGDWTGQKHGVEVIGPLEGRGIQASFIELSKDKQRLKAPRGYAAAACALRGAATGVQILPVPCVGPEISHRPGMSATFPRKHLRPPESPGRDLC